LDATNTQDPFESFSNDVQKRIDSHLTNFASRWGVAELFQKVLAGKPNEWDEPSLALWKERLKNGNYLVVNPDAPCGAGPTYLELERAALGGAASTSCGGRRPKDDALDVTRNWLAFGPKGHGTYPAIDDGVDVPEDLKTTANTFPYLADPHNADKAE
jgi:hypothetical protein